MMLCRLCGNESSADELVISLLDPTNILTFKEFVEYYCQLSLDPCPSLPQRVCRRCKFSIERFAAFSCKVNQAQKTLCENLKQQIKETEEAKADENKISNVCEDKPDATSSGTLNKDIEDHEKSVKKPKLTEPSEDDLLQEISVNRKITEDNKSKTVRQLEEIDLIFDPISAHCEKIQISEDEVEPDGKVPKEWLSRYDDFTSWEDFKYNCSHCKIDFDHLFALTQHCATLPVWQRSIKCHLCGSLSRGISYLGTYINHMSREHFPHIKFCCIICSEVYSNMKHLSAHYQTMHVSQQLSIFPCLDCGFYSHCISALRTHKNQHDSQAG